MKVECPWNWLDIVLSGWLWYETFQTFWVLLLGHHTRFVTGYIAVARRYGDIDTYTILKFSHYSPSCL
jgi:hypothetical protein